MRETPRYPVVSSPSGGSAFESLMPFRVREVLLVSSLYDSFILQEDGHISDLLLEEYQHLNLWYAPRITRVPTAEQALQLLASQRRFDLVITTMRLGDMDPLEFARDVKSWMGPVPIVLLAYNNYQLEALLKSHTSDTEPLPLDRLFVWSGDALILFAIVNLIEDARNIEHDTRAVGVESILFVEDSVRFASAYLPRLYTELLRQSQSLIMEGINLSDKVGRMRARPKIIWCETYEEAMETYEKYKRTMLGVISDVRFPMNGESNRRAGFELTKALRADNPNIPILLQSQDFGNIEQAIELDAAFAHKGSPYLTHEVRQFMLDYFGFGPFVFRHPGGSEVERARDLREFQEKLAHIPMESFSYHAHRNHFRIWLKARTEFRLALDWTPPVNNDMMAAEKARRNLVRLIGDRRREMARSTIADFDPATFDTVSGFARIGGGSLGGKARGLAFVNTLLREYQSQTEQWADRIHILVPPTVVVSTVWFDRFIDDNHLNEIILSDVSDETVRHAFMSGHLPKELRRQLRALVNLMRYPLAVRSSSLLEDSIDQPFAGVYETYMLPNLSGTTEERLNDLCDAVKLVYASAFTVQARTYLRTAPQRPEMEKMAVIIQKLVGRTRENRFYPGFAGAARSYNYYPSGRMTSEDGVAFLALGLGRTVLEGRAALRFCPRYPEHIPQFSTVDDILKNSQKEFFALQLDRSDSDPGERFTLVQYPIAEADHDGTLAPIASTYVPENHTIYDGTARAGSRIVTFATMRKQNDPPIPELLAELLRIGTEGMSSPVEIEFAVNLPEHDGERTEFACLQMRPLVVMGEAVDLTAALEQKDHLFCTSTRALGNGRIKGIHHVVWIDPEKFDRAQSHSVVATIAEFNALLRRDDTPYLLLGPGRWGSSDPWLGIPVAWGNISGVRVVVETSLPDRPVTPSEGSHFFHNMTSFQVGYLTVNPKIGEGMIDWDWLRKQPCEREGPNGLAWMRLDDPLMVLIDGRSNNAVVLHSSTKDGM